MEEIEACKKKKRMKMPAKVSNFVKKKYIYFRTKNITKTIFK